MRSSIRFAHVNVNSLREHFSDVKNLMVNKDVEVFALTKTWLTPDVPSNCLNIDSFHFVRNNRKLAASNKKSFRLRCRRRRLFLQGGGVLIYIRSGIRFKVLAESKLTHMNETEFILIELTVESDQRILLAAVYNGLRALS